jgi:predicted AAA+ superfamily ATPase
MIAVRDDELRQLLRDRNPWWRAAALHEDPTSWAASDPTLKGAAAVDIDYNPDILADVAPPGLWVLRGPRRVGKSVAAKRLLERLCRQSAVDPGQIIYFSADGFRSQDLRRAITLGRDLTRSAGSLARVWVIDEITAVPDWVPVIKELRDNSPLAGDAVVLTGSSAADLDEARRALGAGRTAVANPFRLLLPMTFRAFLTTTKVAVPLPGAVGADELQSAAARRAVQEMEPFVDDFDLAWQRFLECGGFPRAVGEYSRDGEISPEFGFDLRSWLTGDVDAEGPADSVPRLIEELNRRSSSPLDVRNTANALGTTRERLRGRLARLTSTFGAFWCAQADDHGRPLEGAQPKLYLLDPVIARLPSLRDQAYEAPSMTNLTESQLALEMARSIDRIQPDRFVEQRAVMYARTGSGNEVDLAPVPLHRRGQETRTVPVEAKWVTHNWRREALVMRGRYAAGVLATKNIVDLEDDVWAIPAPMVAVLLQ